MYLGIKAVIVKSFARIHRANLINFGIIPLMFADSNDYEKIEKGDILEIKNLIEGIKNNQRYEVKNLTKDFVFYVNSNLNSKEKELILEGGLLPYVRKKVLL